MQSSLRHTYKHCPQSINIAATLVVYFKTIESSSSVLVLKDIRIIKLNSADTQVLRATQPIEDGSDCLDMCLQGRTSTEGWRACWDVCLNTIPCAGVWNFGLHLCEKKICGVYLLWAINFFLQIMFYNIGK
jgi:hypothetical protein